MKPYQMPDFLSIQSLYTDEQIQVMEAVRNFVSEEAMPIINEHFRAGTFPVHLVKRYGEMGLLGSNLSDYGCAGMDNISYGLCLQELERCDSGLRSFASVQSSLVMYPIHAYGSKAQKEKWLPAMAAGEKIGCFGLTEPDFGSDPGGMITRAEKKGAGYVLNGAKAWITNGGIADVGVVWAKLDGTVRGFLVEKGMPGFKANNVEGKFSLRASVTSELVFDNVEIPEDNLLPGVEGLRGPLSCLNQARYGIGWGTLGAAMACFDEAVQYSKERIQFGKPIASFQLVQAKLAHMLTEITNGNLMALRVGQLKDSGEVQHYHISMLKRFNTKTALDCARTTRDILGANGIADEYQAGRHMCNLESVFTYEGTHDIHTLVLGKEITGIQAFS